MEDDVDILELRGGGATATEVTAKQKAAQETVAAPAADNVLAMKAATALQALCGLSGGVLPDSQERPVRPALRRACPLSRSRTRRLRFRRNRSPTV